MLNKDNIVSLKQCIKYFAKAMRGNKNALEYWLDFGKAFAPIYDEVKVKKVLFLKENFGESGIREIYRALLVHDHETAVREKIATGEIANFTTAHRYASKLEREAKAAAKGQDLVDVAPEEPQTVFKRIEFVGTDKQYTSLLSWAKRKGVLVEENPIPVADAPENVTPLPKQPQEGDSDQQLAA